MNKEEFIYEVKKLGIELDNEKISTLERYMDFLISYNEHTNLTAIIDKESIYLKHFYDSLTIVKVVDLNSYSSLVDIGSGAGFPGMVLKIVFPFLEVVLIDSNNKKTTFLKKLSDYLNIKVEVINQRIEDYSKSNLNKFDIVTSRAVANLRVLSELALPLVKPNGFFIPLKGNLDETYENSLDTISLMGAKIESKETFELYNNNGIRNILKIRKEKLTTKDEVRTYDKIIKKPLKKKSK